MPSGTARVLVDQRFSYVEATGPEMDSNLDGWHPESQIPMRLPPERFLMIASGQTPDGFRSGVGSGYDEGSYRKVRERMEAHQPLDPTFIDVDVGDRYHTATVVSHEGRHRALAAHDLGVQEIPVRVFVGHQAPKGKWEYLSTGELTGYQKHNLDALTED